MSSTRTPQELLSELMAEAISRHLEAVGVLIRDVLSHDPKVLLRMLETMHSDAASRDLRIAYLLPQVADVADELGFEDGIFSSQIEQAERWRNDRDLEALIVVVASGEEAKLSSLEDFQLVTSQDLKDVLVARAMKGPVGENDVQAQLWELLATDQTVGLTQLADYYLSLERTDRSDFKRASAAELHWLGLLPDPGLFSQTGAPAMRRRLQSNREIVDRLQTLTPKDRRTIKEVVENETDPDQKRNLSEALDLLHRTRSFGGTLSFIDYEHAQRLIKARLGTSRPTRRRPRSPTLRAVDLAADSLVEPGRAQDLDELLGNLQRILDDCSATSVRAEKIRTPLTDGTTECLATVRLDVLNLVAKMLDVDVYGGLIEMDLNDIDSVLRRFNAQEHVRARWTHNDIRNVLDHIVEATEAGGELSDRFAAYNSARIAALPHLRVLIAEPLVAAAHPQTRRELLAVIDAYKALIETLHQRHEEIFDVVGSDVDELVGRLLLMDIIVVKTADRLFGVLSPIHPLYLWHYATYADLVETQRERFNDQDIELVTDSARQLPNFLSSLYIPAAAFGQGHMLESAGRLAHLPYYSDTVEGSVSDDGVEAIGDLIKGYLAVEPHASEGLRVALVDPPDASPYLRTMVSLHEHGSLRGGHLVVYRHQGARLSTELRLEDDDEDGVSRLFRASNPDRRFTFEVRDRPSDEVGPRADEHFHIAIVFDRSEGRATRTRPTTHPIQPLAVPRRIHYSAIRETVELQPAPGDLFESYHKAAGRISEGSGQGSYLVVHQQTELRATLDEIARRIPLTVVADRHVDRDLHIGTLRVFTVADGERDVAAFARTTSAYRRPLREVARRYNTFIGNAELDELLAQLSDLLDSGLLNVKPDQTGRTNESRIKGLLATLIAARWYRTNAAPDTRLLVSLDSPDARRWMHLSDDPLRADLVGFEWTNDQCTITVLEVKSVETSSSEYTIRDGSVTGPAIQQMLATRRLLVAMLSDLRDDELLTTPARREVLREHLYRELTKGAYSPRERKLWADRLRRLLNGTIKTEFSCHLIDVRLGIDASQLRARDVLAQDGDEMVSVRIHELNEELIDALHSDQHGTTAAPTDTPGTHSRERGQSNASSVSRTALPTPERVQAPVHDADSRIDARRSEPLPTAAVSNPEAAVDPGRPRVLLGTAVGTYGRPREVWFDPDSADGRLPNPHISITGETGSGKTQMAKAIISELGNQRLPKLVLDFKDDYSDESFVRDEGFELYDASFGSLPFNPLTPPIDRRQNLVNPSQHTYQVASIVKRVYKLGDQQAFRLREAIKLSYEAAGVSMDPAPAPTHPSFPPFDDVKERLAGDKVNEQLMGRLSPIFDLGLFRASSEQSYFGDFVERSAVIRLAQLPSDEVKDAVAEFFLMAFYNHLVRQPQIHKLGHVLVLDEAWRLVESPFLTPLMREGRAFGLGVVIASQFPRDLPETVRGSTATRLFFSQGQVEQIREIQRTIVGKTSGPEADHVGNIVRSLPPLSCLLHSAQHAPFVRVTAIPYFRRQDTGA